MADINRPVFGTVWAASGEKLPPTEVKIQSGWIQEMMPYQYQNYLQNRVDNAVTYLLQKGVPEWVATQEYIANKSVVTYSGQLYMATTTTTNVLPTVAASWKRLTTTLAANGTIPVAFGGTGATNAADARINLGLGTAATLDANTLVIKSVTGNAPAADKLTTARTITLTGGASGSVVFDGSSDQSLNITGLNASSLNSGTVPNSALGGAVLKTSATGSAQLPSGTTAERDSAPSDGWTRWNRTNKVLETWNGTQWVGSFAVDLGSLIGIGASQVPTNSLLGSAAYLNREVFVERTDDYTTLRTYTGTATAIEVMAAGIAGLFVRSGSNPDDGGVTIVDGAGRSWERLSVDFVNVKWFGAKGDGTTNDTSSIQSADTYARSKGMFTYIPYGVYMVSQLIIYTNSTWNGDGRDKTIIRSIVGSNLDVLYGNNSNANWGRSTSATLFVDGHELQGLTIDGNYKGGNTSGGGIAVWGPKPVWRDIFVTNTAGKGIRTEFYDSGSMTYGMEGHFDNIRTDYTGQEGWLFNGPHDSTVNDLIVIDASMSADRTYDGVYINYQGNARWSNCHVWSRAIASARTRYGWHDATQGNDVTNTHVEGSGVANIMMNCTLAQYTNVQVYAQVGNGPNVIMRGPMNSFRGLIGAAGTGYTTTGVSLGLNAGDNVSGNIVDIVVQNQVGGAINFAQDAGGNSVHVRGYSYGALGWVGTPANSTSVDINVDASGRKILRQQSGVDTLRGDSQYVQGYGVRDSIGNSASAAGTDQASAAVLDTSTVQAIISVASGAGVSLPTASNFSVGRTKRLYNLGSNPLLVYPEVGSKIYPAATDVAISVPAGKSITVTRFSSTEWLSEISA